MCQALFQSLEDTKHTKSAVLGLFCPWEGPGASRVPGAPGHMATGLGFHLCSWKGEPGLSWICGGVQMGEGFESTGFHALEQVLGASGVPWAGEGEREVVSPVGRPWSFRAGGQHRPGPVSWAFPLHLWGPNSANAPFSWTLAREVSLMHFEKSIRVFTVLTTDQWPCELQGPCSVLCQQPKDLGLLTGSPVFNPGLERQ